MTSLRILWHFQYSDRKKPLSYGSLLVAKLIFHYNPHLQALLARIPFTLGELGRTAGINASLAHTIPSKSQKLLFHFILEKEEAIISFSHFLLEYSHTYLLKIICVPFLFLKNAQTSCWHSHYSPAVLPRQSLGWKRTKTETLHKFHGLKQEMQGEEGKRRCTEIVCHQHALGNRELGGHSRTKIENFLQIFSKLQNLEYEHIPALIVLYLFYP